MDETDQKKQPNPELGLDFPPRRRIFFLPKFRSEVRRRLIGPIRDFYSGERLQEFITRAGHRERRTQQPQKARGPGAALQTRRRERGRLRSGALESRGRDDET